MNGNIESLQLLRDKLFLSLWTSTGIVAASIYAPSGDCFWQLF